MKALPTIVAMALSFAAVAPITQPAQARGVNVQAIVQSNFATRQAQLRSQISSAVNSGQLSPNIASGLLSELDSINAQEQQDLMRGGISNDEANRMNNMFTDVTQRLDASLQYASNPYTNPYGNPYTNNPYRFRHRVGSRGYFLY